MSAPSCRLRARRCLAVALLHTVRASLTRRDVGGRAVIGNPEPPAVAVQTEHGAETGSVFRETKAALIFGRREVEELATSRIGDLTITVTPGAADALALPQ